MSSSTSGDEWADDDTSLFLEHGDVFVPARERQHRVVQLALGDLGGAVVHDLCCGEARLAEHLLATFESARVVGWDASDLMLQHARARCARFGDRFSARSFRLQESGWREALRGADAVVSSLAIHHLDSGEKQRLFRDVHDALADRGAFVFADIVAPQGARARAVAAAEWDAAVLDQSARRPDGARAVAAFRDTGWNAFAAPEMDPVDKPSSVAEQLAWLGRAGFTSADTLWMMAGHVVLGAWKR